MDSQSFQKAGARTNLRSRFFFALSLLISLGAGSCALLETRPVQEMSDTQAAIRAAREVQADTIMPELYRQANEWFFKARHEYKVKNYKLAREYADKARRLAEHAEFEAVRNGGSRSADTTPSEPPPPPPMPPSDYATPTPTPADSSLMPPPPPQATTPSSPNPTITVPAEPPKIP